MYPVFLFFLLNYVVFTEIFSASPPRVNSLNKFSDKYVSRKFATLAIDCKWFEGCTNTLVFDIIGGKVYVCGNCENVAEPLKSFPISSMSSENLLLSTTYDVNIEPEVSKNYENKTSNRDKSLFVKKRKMTVYGNFEKINGTECHTNKENKQKFNFEFFIQYYKKKHDIILDINVSDIFNTTKNDSQKVISNWSISELGKNNSIYFFKTIERDEIEEIKYVSDIFYTDGKSNDKLPLLELICNSKEGCDEDQFKVFASISCHRNTNKYYYKSKPTNDIETKDNPNIKDIIMLVGTIKQNSYSYRKYIKLIRLFIKTLLKVLRKEENNGNISLKCTHKVVEWIKELCILLGIDFGEISKSIHLYRIDVDYVGYNRSETHQYLGYNISNKEATVKEYQYLEEILGDS